MVNSPHSHSRRLLLLGLGNDLLSDDAIGLRVAEGARPQLTIRENVTVIVSAEMGLALLDVVSGFDDLVVVDAAQIGRGAPGSVHEFDLSDLKTIPIISPHFLGFGETLALGRRLGLEVPNRVKILAIEVQDPYTVGTQLTPALREALPHLVERAVSTCLSGSFLPQHDVSSDGHPNQVQEDQHCEYQTSRDRHDRHTV